MKGYLEEHAAFWSSMHFVEMILHIARKVTRVVLSRKDNLASVFQTVLENWSCKLVLNIDLVNWSWTLALQTDLGKYIIIIFFFNHILPLKPGLASTLLLPMTPLARLSPYLWYFILKVASFQIFTTSQVFKGKLCEQLNMGKSVLNIEEYIFDWFKQHYTWYLITESELVGAWNSSSSISAKIKPHQKRLSSPHKDLHKMVRTFLTGQRWPYFAFSKQGLSAWTYRDASSCCIAFWLFSIKAEHGTALSFPSHRWSLTIHNELGPTQLLLTLFVIGFLARESRLPQARLLASHIPTNKV